MSDIENRPRHLQSLARPTAGGGELHSSDGIPLPAQPRVGFKLRVKWGPRYWNCSGWRVTAVNSRSFYVWANGWKQRFLLEEWGDFLRARLREGDVTVVAQPPPPDLRVVK